MNKLYKFALIVLLLVTPFLGLVPRAFADEQLSVTDNGSGSSNQIQAGQSNTTDVSQSNTAQVQNDIVIDANTGGNTAEDNVGNAANVTTGDASVASTVSNTMNTSSMTNDPCCPAGASQGTISGNGSGSANSLSFTSSFSGNAGMQNNASITNSITGHVTTGNNTASSNAGNVSITTGNISVTEQIMNKANVSHIAFGDQNTAEVDMTISDNGTESNNSLTYDNSNTVVAAVNNQANIFNDSFWELVSGNNEANDNSGNVEIKTGDIHFEESVINEVNVSDVIVTCCKEEEHKPQPITPPEKPVSPKPGENSGGGNGGPGNSSNGASAGSAIENVLPVTGNMWLYMALAANIAMLIFGTYLRLRSGRSPSVVTA